PCVGSDAFRRWQKCCVFCRFILRHELRSPGNTAKADLGSLGAIIDADVAVPIGILTAAVRKASRHYRATFQSLSSGFRSCTVSVTFVYKTIMLPSREISAPPAASPALRTALTARVTSACVNNLRIFIVKTTSSLRIKMAGAKTADPSMPQNKVTP